MLKTLKITLTSIVLSLMGTAQAYVIDFISLTETTLGESAWETLSLDGGVSVTGHYYDGTELKDGYAYLDWRRAGLGMCKDAKDTGAHPGDSSNRCNPGSDDNVTYDEFLRFSFDYDTVIDWFWFNNNHDGGFGAGDMVTIGGADYSVDTGYAGSPVNGIGPFMVSAGSTLDVAFKNEQFYISGMKYSTSVSEPGTVALLGMGLVGLALARRRQRIAT